MRRLEIRKAKLEGLLRLAIAGPTTRWAAVTSQDINSHTLFDWPRYRLLGIDFQRELCGVANIKQAGKG